MFFGMILVCLCLSSFFWRGPGALGFVGDFRFCESFFLDALACRSYSCVAVVSS